MDKEKKDKRTGLAVSTAVHAVLILLFFFILAWREPNPPLPEYGIELNFGLEEAGSGAVQPLNPAADTDRDEPSTSESETAVETDESTMEESSETTEEVESAVTEVEETTADDVSEPIEQVEPITDQDSPDMVPDVEEQVPLEEQDEPEATESEISESETSEKDPAADGTNDAIEEQTGGLSQGDQEEATGDQGDPEGSLDSRALYGNPGGGDGASLSLTGWVWDREPRPEDSSNEAGRIVFEIEVDDFGDLVSIRTVEKTVSPAVEKVYRQEVEKLTFSPTSDNPTPAPRSRGRITFVIRRR
jgi:outer membrane biosynthesis protein TonB